MREHRVPSCGSTGCQRTYNRLQTASFRLVRGLPGVVDEGVKRDGIVAIVLEAVVARAAASAGDAIGVAFESWS